MKRMMRIVFGLSVAILLARVCRLTHAKRALVLVAVMAGLGGMPLIAAEGDLWGWGHAADGELGPQVCIPFTTDPMLVTTGVIACSAGSSFSVAVKQDGTVWAWGSITGQSTPAQVPGLTGITDVQAGQSHVLALKSDGTVWGWGANSWGQLGPGSTNSVEPLPVQIPGLTGITAIAAQEGQSGCVDANGKVCMWGIQFFGELGNGSHEYAVIHRTPVTVGGLPAIVKLHCRGGDSMAVGSNGTVWTWGKFDWGNGANNDSRFSPIQVSGVSGAIAAASYAGSGAALKSDGTVWTWGSAPLGDGSTTPATPSFTAAKIPNLGNVVEISSGLSYVLLRKTDGTVWGFGRNEVGQQGDGTQLKRLSPLANGVAGIARLGNGFMHSLAICGPVSTNGPSIDGISPLYGPTAGGTSLTITGQRLDGVNEVTFSGVPTASITNSTPTAITVITPAHAAGAVDITVKSGAQSASRLGAFTYLTGSPNITGLSPTNASERGGTWIIISGTSLSGSSHVSFGGIAVDETKIILNSDTQVYVVAPPHPPGKVDLVLTANAGMATKIGAFTYTAETVPILFSLDVPTGPATGGTTVVLSGERLSTVTNITFGGNAVTGITARTDNTLTVTTPTGVVSVVDVTIKSPQGAMVLPNAFTYTGDARGISTVGISCLGAQGISLTAAGAIGTPYRFWASTNLALTPATNVWNLQGAGTITASPFTTNDLTSAEVPARFYRFSSP